MSSSAPPPPVSLSIKARTLNISERPHTCNPRLKQPKTVLKKLFSPPIRTLDQIEHVIANHYLDYKLGRIGKYRRRPKTVWFDSHTKNVNLCAREILQIPKYTLPRRGDKFIQSDQEQTAKERYAEISFEKLNRLALLEREDQRLSSASSPLSSSIISQLVLPYENFNKNNVFDGDTRRNSTCGTFSGSDIKKPIILDKKSTRTSQSVRERPGVVTSNRNSKKNRRQSNSAHVVGNVNNSINKYNSIDVNRNNNKNNEYDSCNQQQKLHQLLQQRKPQARRQKNRKCFLYKNDNFINNYHENYQYDDDDDDNNEDIDVGDDDDDCCTNVNYNNKFKNHNNNLKTKSNVESELYIQLASQWYNEGFQSHLNFLNECNRRSTFVKKYFQFKNQNLFHNDEHLNYIYKNNTTKTTTITTRKSNNNSNNNEKKSSSSNSTKTFGEQHTTTRSAFNPKKNLTNSSGNKLNSVILCNIRVNINNNYNNNNNSRITNSKTTNFHNFINKSFLSGDKILFKTNHQHFLHDDHHHHHHKKGVVQQTRTKSPTIIKNISTNNNNCNIMTSTKLNNNSTNVNQKLKNNNNEFNNCCDDDDDDLTNLTENFKEINFRDTNGLNLPKIVLTDFSTVTTQQTSPQLDTTGDTANTATDPPQIIEKVLDLNDDNIINQVIEHNNHFTHDGEEILQLDSTSGLDEVIKTTANNPRKKLVYQRSDSLGLASSSPDNQPICRNESRPPNY